MIEDGDIGYEGEYHASFVARRLPRVAHIRATAAGDAELARIRALLSKHRTNQPRRAPARSASIVTARAAFFQES
ncbi:MULTISPECIES: hypothetical protein [unclassified Burkholderia]|uniref:hypothetical protein n=1 Tax=unclassified Burkholderia TaxID=2613784 RepID=UPI001E34D6BE|nr:MULTISPECIES: hypothetical protein [unclassified Burkholderia]UEP45628.1 hypothetical protein LMA02_23240 [Burkholderia sp. B21-005]